MAYAAGAYPLDMSQYSRLFRSTRIPRVLKDELVTHVDSRHIMVQRGAEFFAVDVLNSDGTAVPRAAIEAAFRAILASPRSDAPAVGLLTTLNRDHWATVRHSLRRPPQPYQQATSHHSAIVRQYNLSCPPKRLAAARTMFSDTLKVSKLLDTCLFTRR